MTAAASDAWVEQARAVPIESEIARRGGLKLQRRGKELVGPCPRCGGDDRFGVNVTKQIFNCRGCGAKGDVIDLVMHLDGADFIAAAMTLAGERPQAKPGKANGKDEQAVEIPIYVTKFIYEDESGNPLFAVARYEFQNADGSYVLKADGKRKKMFPQYRPDPERPGKWLKGVGGVRVVPYRLPELIEAISNGHFIAIVEGEGKVDLLRTWNIPATCCAEGKEKWKAEHSEFLRGADVIILPDNDEGGRKHCDKVATSLHGIAASVRVLELPNLSPKGDIIDWAKAGGTVEQLHDLIQREARPWAAQHSEPETQGAPRPDTGAGVSLDDFYAYMLAHGYIFTPTGEIWPTTSVNARLQAPEEKVSASKWLDQNRPVEQMTWAPGKPKLIKDSLISSGGWITRRGCTVFNLYRPPRIAPQAGDVTPWLDLIKKVFPDQADHIVLFLAHRLQRPGEKINHALALGGEPGIGKDTILEPVKQAIGPWNFSDVSPKQVLGRFNSFLRSVILRVNEARDLGDFDRYAFYDHMKVIIAAPPDVLLVDQKHVHEHYIPNLCSVIITTNHKTDGIYLPADDRRHMVAWSNLTKDDFAGDYWRKLYGWYANGGNEHVAAHLAGLDLSCFDPKAPPPKTQAFWEIANANRAPEDAELADVLDDLGRPDVVTLSDVTNRAIILQPAFGEWLRDRRNRRSIPHRFEDCAYVVVSNPNDSEGRWKISGTRHTIYGKASLTVRDRIAAAMKFAGTR